MIPRVPRSTLVPALALACLTGAVPSDAARATDVTVVTATVAPSDAFPAPALSRSAPKRMPGSNRVVTRGARLTSGPGTLLATANDTYMQDGAAPVVALNATSPASLMVAFNEGWDFDPDIPLCSSASNWNGVAFPPGSGIFGGYPHTPWAAAGNNVNELFVSLEREDLYPTDNTHTLLTRSTNGGATFSTFYEVPRNVRQDRAMFDVDRPAARGATTGAHDGKVYLCFDDWGTGGSGYTGSYLDVLGTGGSLLSEITLSAPGASFRGSQFQPVAGLEDGRIYLVSNSLANGGATVTATFHQIDGGGGGGTQFSKSVMSWAPAGQKLGSSTHRGVNGHRVDERGFLDVDRSNGERRGYLYFITNRNPNPANPALDQGDLFVSTSFTFGSSWQFTRKLPSASGQTQFFPMMDVDDQGWIHVAYYQNEIGSQNGGVLNASVVDLCYTVSRDGGVTWSPPVKVNSTEHSLSMEDPPLQWGSVDYDVLGDYMQLQATGTDDNTVAYVGWTGYDQTRTDDGVGTKKQRVYLTAVNTPPAPAATPRVLALLSLVVAAAGAVALRRRLGAPEA